VSFFFFSSFPSFFLRANYARVRDAKRLSIVYYVMCDDDNGRGEARRSSSFQRRPDRTAYAVFSIGGAPKTLTRRAPLLLLHRARSCFEPGYTQECGAIGKCVAKRRYTLARNDRRMWSTLNRGQTEKSLP